MAFPFFAFDTQVTPARPLSNGPPNLILVHLVDHAKRWAPLPDTDQRTERKEQTRSRRRGQGAFRGGKYPQARLMSAEIPVRSRRDMAPISRFSSTVWQTKVPRPLRRMGKAMSHDVCGRASGPAIGREILAGLARLALMDYICGIYLCVRVTSRGLNPHAKAFHTPPQLAH